MDINKTLKDINSLRIKHKRREWEPLMRKYNCEKVCEIGVWDGYNFDLMVRHNPKLAVAVDAWIDDGVLSRNIPIRRNVGCSQAQLNEKYETFKNGIGNKPFVQIHRGYSTEVVKQFEDNYFDFIYIDADHTYEACLQDIKDWYPKVKSGKFLFGDDYRTLTFRGVKFGVIEAVNKFAKDNNIKFYEFPRYLWGMIKL